MLPTEKLIVSYKCLAYITSAYGMRYYTDTA